MFAPSGCIRLFLGLLFCLAVSGCPGGSTIIPLASGTPHHLAFEVAPRSSEIQNTLWETVIVRVEDAAGNLVADATNAVTASLVSGGGTLSGTLTQNAQAGRAIFSDLFHNVAVPIKVEFTAAGLLKAGPASVTIMPCVAGTPAILSYGTPPPVSMARDTLWPSVEVIVKDCTGALVSTDGMDVTAEVVDGTGILSGTLTQMTASGSVTFSDLSYDKSHLVMFRATSTSGVTSLWGPVIGFYPPSPQNVMIAPHDGYVTLTWDAVPDVPGYNIYWDTMTGVTKLTGTAHARATNSFEHAGLINGEPYYYVITAEDTGGESDDSSEVSGAPADGAGSDDPLFAMDLQWHLLNTVQIDQDLNVTPVWNTANATSRGEGVRVALVDDGLEIAHEDIRANVATDLSYNYRTDTTDPTGGEHGTCVGGIIAARDLNDLGGRGVSPRANLVAYNALQVGTSSVFADAMSRGSPDVWISNNSWGPADGRGTLDDSSSLWRTAVDGEITSGRNGLGTVFLVAGGNGGDEINSAPDNSNYDGNANYRKVLAICAVNENGTRSFYSEKGANLWVCGPSGGDVGQRDIVTTDRSGAQGYNDGTPPDLTDANYTNSFSGTSAATPAVAGVVALLLQAYPALGWRDVREILAGSARMNDPLNTDWFTNGGGFHVNHQYGFGVADAEAALTLASGWTVIAVPQLTSPIIDSSGDGTLPVLIPDNNSTGVTRTLMVNVPSITFIESVEITFSAPAHTYSGDLEITLTSPFGTESVLAEAHLCAGSCTSYDAWVFSSARHLGENPAGMWTLKVRDLAPADFGLFTYWKLRFYGR